MFCVEGGGEYYFFSLCISYRCTYLQHLDSGQRFEQILCGPIWFIRFPCILVASEAVRVSETLVVVDDVGLTAV